MRQSPNTKIVTRMSKENTGKGGKIYSGSWFHRFQFKVSWMNCFGIKVSENTMALGECGQGFVYFMEDKMQKTE